VNFDSLTVIELGTLRV